MAGLVLGVSRMAMDFAYTTPKCHEVDERPFIIGQIHYMYFAAFLFWMTGIVCAVITLLTPPDPEYMVRF